MTKRQGILKLKSQKEARKIQCKVRRYQLTYTVGSQRRGLLSNLDKIPTLKIVYVLVVDLLIRKVRASGGGYILTDRITWHSTN